MPILMNSTNEAVRCQHGGAYYTFKPLEEKEVYDAYAARHILNRWGKYGIVELNFSEKESKKYLEFDEYKYAQRILGLSNYLKTLEETVFNFELYDESCGEKQSIYRHQHKRTQDTYKEKVKLLTAELDKLKSIDVRKTPKQRADILMEKARLMREEAELLLKGSKHGNNTAKLA